MKLDAFAKSTLVLIALFLAVIAVSNVSQTQTANATPGGKFDYIQIWNSSANIQAWSGQTESGWILFDARTGELWAYSQRAILGRAEPYFIGKLTEIGKSVKSK